MQPHTSYLMQLYYSAIVSNALETTSHQVGGVSVSKKANDFSQRRVCSVQQLKKFPMDPPDAGSRLPVRRESRENKISLFVSMV